MSVPLQLSQTKPDFESLVLQLQLYLSTKGSWIDQQTSSTGEALIETFAAVGTFNQFAVEMAFREAFITTAQRDSSIYAGTDLLGVHVVRKTPAKVQVVLRRTRNTNIPLVIPRLSAFTIDGTSFFNRIPVTFQSGATESAEVTLYQGELRTQTFPGRSTSFQEITLNEPGFVVSDNDVYVYLVNPTTGERQSWTRTEDGLWIASSTDKVFYDRTDGNGNCLLTFGDGTHGQMPSIGYNIEVVYAITSGSTGNNGGSGLTAQYTQDNDVQGLTLGTVVGGADEKPAKFYRYLAPQIYRARRRSVTPGDYKAITISYPGVASAVVQAQKDIAPGDLRWMNVVRICILPQVGDSFTEIEWTDFLAWMETKKHAAIQLQKYNPVRRDVSIKLKIALKQNAVPGEVYPVVDSQIKSLFERDEDSLGRRIAVSDIIAEADIDAVDYVQIITPTSDFYVTTEEDLNAPYIWWNLVSLDIEMVYSERRQYNDR